MKKRPQNFPALSILSVVLLNTLSGACVPVKQNTSTNKNLSPLNFQCTDPSPQRISEVRAHLPVNFVRGYSAAGFERALVALASVPDRDTNYLIGGFSKQLFQGIIRVENLPPQVLGRTHSAGAAGDWVPILVETLDSANDKALRHEIGHASEPVAREKARALGLNFNQAQQEMALEFASKPDLVRGYAREMVREGWAEAYHDFYCSPDSNKNMAVNLPGTYEFVSKVLDPPLFANVAPFAPPVFVPPAPPTPQAALQLEHFSVSMVDKSSSEKNVMTGQVLYVAPGSEILIRWKATGCEKVTLSGTDASKLTCNSAYKTKIQSTKTFTLTVTSASGSAPISQSVEFRLIDQSAMFDKLLKNLKE